MLKVERWSEGDKEKATVTAICDYCNSTNLIRHGRDTLNGKKRFRCRDCGRRSRDYPDRAYTRTERFKADVVAQYLNSPDRLSLRRVSENNGVTHRALAAWVRESQARIAAETDAKTDAGSGAATRPVAGDPTEELKPRNRNNSKGQ